MKAGYSMPVYVDSMKAKFGRMTMCHMIADTTDELNLMADAIGVARKWIQYPGTPKEHYDISMTKRADAVVLGAVEVTWRQTGAMVMARYLGLEWGDLDTLEQRVYDELERRRA